MALTISKVTKLLGLKPFYTFLARSLQQNQNCTSGIIVIGDEILKGDVMDTNSHYMATKFHKTGIKVKKISVIGDSIQEISDEVKLFSKQYTYVITSGGIGPTHDDVTFEGIAKAFNKKIITHPDLVELCRQFYQTVDPSYPGMKLARVPESCELRFLQDQETGVRKGYPCVSIENVFILPGIPQLCRKTFDLLATAVFKSSSKFYTKVVYVNVTEDKIAPALNTLVKEFPEILVGSYPELFNNAYKVRITIESTAEKLTTEAYNKLIKLVPNENIVRV